MEQIEINPITLIDDVSKNLEILKKIVIPTPKIKKEKKEKDPNAVHIEKLPKYVYEKEGFFYKAKIEGGEKIELKKYILEKFLI